VRVAGNGGQGSGVRRLRAVPRRGIPCATVSSGTGLSCRGVLHRWKPCRSEQNRSFQMTVDAYLTRLAAVAALCELGASTAAPWHTALKLEQLDSITVLQARLSRLPRDASCKCVSWEVPPLMPTALAGQDVISKKIRACREPLRCGRRQYVSAESCPRRPRKGLHPFRLVCWNSRRWYADRGRVA